MKIVFPELTTNTVAQEAIKLFPDIDWLPAANLEEAARLVQTGHADSMISGLDYSSRDVLLAYKTTLPLNSRFFSSCFICEQPEAPRPSEQFDMPHSSEQPSTSHSLEQSNPKHLLLADGGVNKLPTLDQFITIIEDSAHTYEIYYEDQPKIAILSYSTYGSGGKNPDLEKFHAAIAHIRATHPNWLIDGEMQLDAAMSPAVAKRKTPDSPLEGRANVLITPDLNSGNILYKSLERFGGYTVAGPIIQGFRMPLADLSRGSSLADTILTIKVIKTLYERTSL